MNLSEFRTRAARVSGMSTSDSGDLALLDIWANEAVVQFLRDTKMHVKKAALAVIANRAEYTLDTDILSFTDAYYTPASGQQGRKLRPVDSGQIVEMQQLGALVDVDTTYYALQGANVLMLYPAPASSNDVLHVWYVPRPSAMSLTADTPSVTANGGIPSEFHPVLLDYVLWKACEAEEHRPSEGGLKFQAAYERGIQKARGDMARKAGVTRAPARWGRRPRPVSPRPGVYPG